MKPKKTPPPPVSSPESRSASAPTREQIAALAHAIWIDRGQPEGLEMDHWLEAERQLTGQLKRPAAADEIPADHDVLNPDRALETKVDREIKQIGNPAPPRSATSL